MAYDPANLFLQTGKRGNRAPRYWSYVTTDAVATVRAANYITNALVRGMRPNDLVFVHVVNGSGVPTAVSVCTVVSVAETGADLTDGTALTQTNT